ncbi:glycosyltransferase family 39 protein [Candidatus Woesearchaeota archaeon]|nr:glycosyltransferase family 39 protein [Candidatus Woesearchaeota archaeon]
MRLLQKTLRDKQLQPLLLVLAVFAAAKAAFLLRYHLPIWDEAVYLGMGKYVYSLGGSGLWEILRPLGLPLITGMVWKLHLPQVLFSEIVTVAFGAGSIALCYLIGKRLFGRNVAVLAAALLAASPVFFLYSSYILTEVPSTFFVLAAIYFFISKRCYLCGSSAALAMLFKFPNGLALAAIAAAVIIPGVISRKSQLWPLIKILAAFFLVTLPFLVFNYVFYRPFTSNPFDAIFRPFILGAWHQSNPAKAITDPLLNYSFYAIEAFKQHFVFVLAIAAAFLFWKRKWFSDPGKLLLASYFAIYAAYFTYIPNKDERFLILFLPAICIFAAAAFFEVLKLSRGINLKHLKPMRSLALVAIMALLLLSFAVAGYKDYHFYSWRPSSEPAVASELYKSLPGLGVKGAVLTSEPFFSVYNDNLFIYYYFTSFEGIPQELKALNDWQQNRTFQGIIYSNYPGTLFCPQSDSECTAARANLYDYVESRFKPVLNGTYYDGLVSYTVFVSPSNQNKQNS